jgi:hypothetical protein
LIGIRQTTAFYLVDVYGVKTTFLQGDCQPRPYIFIQE